MEKCEKPSNWLDTPKSGFIRAFEVFWNTWGCHRKNLMVIVCGSANSWIQDKLINNHGGLYNRLFASVFVNPEVVKNIVQLLYIRNAGFTRAEIVKKLGITDGGRLSRYLNASISSWRGFAFENSW